MHSVPRFSALPPCLMVQLRKCGFASGRIVLFICTPGTYPSYAQVVESRPA